MSLKYALNPCLLQGRRSTSQGRAVRFIQPLAVPNCSFPEAANSFCFLFLVYFVANGVQLKRSQLEEILKMQKKKKEESGVGLTRFNQQALAYRQIVYSITAGSFI